MHLRPPYPFAEGGRLGRGSAGKRQSGLCCSGVGYPRRGVPEEGGRLASEPCGEILLGRNEEDAEEDSGVISPGFFRGFLALKVEFSLFDALEKRLG